MNYCKVKHLEFVPAKHFEEVKDLNNIFVFTHKQNNRVYKKKIFPSGRIFKHPKTNSWCFVGDQTCCYDQEFLLIVHLFLKRLDDGKIKYDEEKGELMDVSI